MGFTYGDGTKKRRLDQHGEHTQQVTIRMGMGARRHQITSIEQQRRKIADLGKAAIITLNREDA